MATKTVSKSDITKEVVFEEIKNIGLVGIGLVGGSFLGSQIDKMVKIDPDKKSVKPFLRPALLLGAGVFGVIKGTADPKKKREENKPMKLVATGVGAAGVLSLAKLAMKKDFLSGLENVEGLENIDMSVYTEPIDLSIDRYSPDLPSLMASPLEMLPEPTSYTEDISGIDGDEMNYFEII